MWDEILPTAEWVKSNMPQVRTHTFTQIALTNFKHKVTLTCKEFCPVKVLSITYSRDSVILVIDVDFFLAFTVFDFMVNFTESVSLL